MEELKRPAGFAKGAIGIGEKPAGFARFNPPKEKPIDNNKKK